MKIPTLTLAELERLRLALESAELRIRDAEVALERVREEIQDARIALTMMKEAERTIAEFGPPEHTHWVVGGIPS